MLSFKVIKSAEVRDNLLQVLPLRKASVNNQTGIPEQGSESRDVLANFQAWAVAQAEDTISRARDMADEIIRQTRIQIEEIKQEAYHKAYELGLAEGLNKGYREGLSRAEQEADSLRSQAREVLAQAEQIRRKTMESLENEIIELARDIAERLLSKNLEPETVINVAEESLRLVSDRMSVFLYVNPSDMEPVENKKERLLRLLPAGATIHFITDSGISPGGCLIETEKGLVDATLEKRKSELMDALYGRE